MISVLIPTRNRPQLLAYAVTSAKHQVGQVEIIVEHDPAGRGQSATLNCAFQRSTGDYVTVCHDDDFYWRDDALALLETQLRFHPEAGAVFSLPQYVDADGMPLVTPPKLADWMAAHPVVRWDTLFHGLHMHGTGVLYKRAWWEPWDETLPCCEEYEFHLRLLSKGCVFVGLPVITMAYRQHRGQASARGSGTWGRTSARTKAIRERIRQQYAMRAAS